MKKEVLEWFADIANFKQYHEEYRRTTDLKLIIDEI